MSAILPHMVWP